MPNRIIKESVCGSETVDALSWFEEVFFYRLIVNCDDYGRMDARPAILRSRLFPLKNVTDKQVVSALQSLRSAGIVDLYDVDDHPFLQMRTWERHQSIRAKKSRYPSPKDDLLANDFICKQMQANAPVIQSESESNNTHTFTGACAPAREEEIAENPPKEADVVAEFTRLSCKDPAGEAKSFVEYNSARGWSGADWRTKAALWAKRAEHAKRAKSGSKKQEIGNPASSFDAEEFFAAALKKTYGGSDDGEN